MEMEAEPRGLPAPACPALPAALARPTAVVGIGNILLRDEGIGVRAIELLSEKPLPATVELIDGGTSGFDLIDAIADRAKLVIIDALLGSGPPGSVTRLSLDELLPAQGARLSIHQLGILESLEMARALGCAPAEVVVYGVQPAVIEPGLELSPELARALPELLERLLEELHAERPPSSRESRAAILGDPQ